MDIVFTCSVHNPDVYWQPQTVVVYTLQSGMKKYTMGRQNINIIIRSTLLEWEIGLIIITALPQDLHIHIHCYQYYFTNRAVYMWRTASGKIFCIFPKFCYNIFSTFNVWITSVQVWAFTIQPPVSYSTLQHSHYYCQYWGW